MTAVLAAAGRGALLLAVLAALLLPAYGPRGAWTLAWLLAAAAAVWCAVPAWIALQPRTDDGDCVDCLRPASRSPGPNSITSTLYSVAFASR